MRQSFDSEPRQECPRCGNVAKRLLFPPPIVFKGSVTVPAAEPVADGKKASTEGNGTKTDAVPAPAAKSESSTTSSSSSD
jgi:predicted nucleic acid-binding Zn ribbon protein